MGHFQAQIARLEHELADSKARGADAEHAFAVRHSLPFTTIASVDHAMLQLMPVTTVP